MNVSGRTTVSKLKTMFKEEFGIGVRIYNGNRVAESSATLASIRSGSDARKSDFELCGDMKVGDAEKLFKDVFGISIQIENKDGTLADDSVTVASLKSANNVKTVDNASYPKTSVLKIKKGDCVEFGSYYQNNVKKKTPVEWLVLKRSGSKVLLISRYGLDCKQYHHERVDMTWKNCDLRKWLNGEFLEIAFTDEERKKIVVTKLVTCNNSEFCTFGGNNTEDRVFCLSRSEAESFFKDDMARKCAPTRYAAREGAYEDTDHFIEGRACCWWWLRSPGSDQSKALGVNTDGRIGSLGDNVHNCVSAVRPSLWVSQDCLKAVNLAAIPNNVKTTDKATAATKVAAAELRKGDYFKFGNYYQENSRRKTPIEWLVLKTSGSKALLISRDGLDCMQYHREHVDMTWENCDLRKWLNGEFLESAFTEEEQKKIAVTKLANDNNAKWGTLGGNSTEDRVYCLSLAEAKSLFYDNEARKCAMTPYAAKKAATGRIRWNDFSELSDGRRCCCWWLRSPGSGQNFASCVSTFAELDLRGCFVANDSCAVRPVLWVNL